MNSYENEATAGINCSEVGYRRKSSEKVTVKETEELGQLDEVLHSLHSSLTEATYGLASSGGVSRSIYRQCTIWRLSKGLSPRPHGSEPTILWKPGISEGRYGLLSA